MRTIIYTYIHIYIYIYVYILYILFSYCESQNRYVKLGKFDLFLPVDLKDGRANTFNRLRFKKVQTLL